MNMPIQVHQDTSISSTSLIMQGDSFDRVMRLAEIMAGGFATVPKHFQKNVGDCAAIVMQSMQWNMNPYSVAQKTFLIDGKLGYEAQLINAVINSMSPTKDRLNYEWFGNWEPIIGNFKEIESRTKKDDDGHPKKYRVPGWTIAEERGLGIHVWATLKGEDQPRKLTLLMTQARVRNSPLWADDPKQQLAYLATKRWARLYCPDVILGVYTPDELEVVAPEREINPISGASQTSEPLTANQLPAMEDDKFKKNFASYEAGITSGRKKADDVIAALSMKYTLTDEQISAIRSVPEPIEGQAEEIKQ